MGHPAPGRSCVLHGQKVDDAGFESLGHSRTCLREDFHLICDGLRSV